MVTSTEVKNIGQILNNSDRPLKERFRALFTLKNIGGQEAIDEISKSFQDKSELLKHEVAYCLGQMGDKNAIPILSSVLKDLNQEPIVRHEAGEALGAIGDTSVLPMLIKIRDEDKEEVVIDTCILAVERLQWIQNGQGMYIQRYKFKTPKSTLCWLGLKFSQFPSSRLCTFIGLMPS